MLRASLLLAVWLAAVSGAAALPRAAVVSITDIHRELASTAELQRNAEQTRRELIDNERAEVMRAAITELEALENHIRTNNLSNSQEVMRDFDSKRREVLVLQEEFERFRGEEERRINREMVQALKESLGRITEVARGLAAERGYELLFDSSGNSNTGLPVLIHAKGADDITDAVRIRLSDLHGESSANQAGAAEESDATPDSSSPPPTDPP